LKAELSLNTHGENMKRILIPLLFLCTSAIAADLQLPLLWTINTHTFLESAPILADIDNDGRTEIIVAGREEIIVLEDNGKEAWRWHTRGRYMTDPAVLMRKRMPPYIYATDFSGLLTCLDAKGQKVWQAELNGPSSWSAAVVGDLNADDSPEVIQTDEKGTIWTFDALTGKKLWNTTVKGMPVSPAIGDLNGDGQLEVVVATGEGLVATMQHDGRVIWQREIGGTSETWSTSSPVIFAASDGQSYVAAASSTGKLFCIDQQGDVVWQHPTIGPVASSISVGDFDLDGRADIFLITQLGVVYRFDESGNLLWEIDMQGRSLAPGAILDINNDGKLEFVLCTQQGYLLALDNRGETIFDYQFGNRTINVTPAFGNVTGNAENLEMVITGGESGKVFCFATPAKAFTQQQWTVYRGDSQNTGAWFGRSQPTSISMTPQNLFDNQLLTGESIRFSIRNPQPDKTPLQAGATCIGPDGKRQTALAKVIGKQGELLLPISVLLPGTHHFSWALSSDEGQTLVAGERMLTLQPFANDRSLAERALAALQSTADAVQNTLPLSARALRNEHQQLSWDAPQAKMLQEAIQGADQEAVQKTIEITSRLVAQAKRTLQISKTIQQAALLGTNMSLIAFEGTVWENRGVDERLPARVQNPLPVNRTVVPNEHQSIPISLFNITDRSLQVRVQIDSIPAHISMTPHRSVATPTSIGEVSWDALPEVDESGVIDIPSFSTREVWLEVAIGSAPAGLQRFNVKLQALNGAGVLDAPTNPHPVPAPVTQVQMALDVLPFTLAPAGDFRLCTWSPSEGPAIGDLLAHGNNVFNAPHGLPKYNESGELAEVDFARLDAITNGLKGHDVILLLNGFPQVKVEVGTAAYQKELKAYLDRLVTHLSGQGIDTRHFALYPIDEPGGYGWLLVNKLVEFGKVVRACNPKVMLYVDGGGEEPMFQAMAPVMDIWTPSIYQLAEDSPEMKIMRSNGQMLWSYNCGYGFSRPVGPNLKNINIIAEYRTAALFALRHGATGIGYWCYNAGGENPWERIKYEYNIVYPGRSKPVTSRRWEAVREGIEDFRILLALKHRLEETGDRAINGDLQSKIKHLLEVSLPELVDQGYQEMTIGLARNVLDASNNDQRLNAFRREMLECVAKVSEKSE